MEENLPGAEIAFSAELCREQGIWGTHAALRVLHRGTDSGVMWPVAPETLWGTQEPEEE